MRLIALRPQVFQLFDLPGPHGGIINLQHFDWRFVLGPVTVNANDYLLSAVDPGLSARGSLLDLQLRQAGIDGFRHAAKLFDFLDVLPSLSGKLVSEPLDIIAAAPRIDDARRPGFIFNEELGVAGDAS